MWHPGRVLTIRRLLHMLRHFDLLTPPPPPPPPPSFCFCFLFLWKKIIVSTTIFEKNLRKMSYFDPYFGQNLANCIVSTPFWANVYPFIDGQIMAEWFGCSTQQWVSGLSETRGPCLKLASRTRSNFLIIGMYSISQEICTRFLLCRALLWLRIDWFTHIHQAYFTGTVAIWRLPQCQLSNPDEYG